MDDDNNSGGGGDQAVSRQSQDLILRQSLKTSQADNTTPKLRSVTSQ